MQSADDKNRSTKHDVDEVQTPTPPQHMDPSVKPDTQKNQPSKKKASAKKTVRKKN